jgi:FAD/FMN-containing dehydrogenase
MLRGCGEAKVEFSRKGAKESQSRKEEFSAPLRLSDSFAPLRETHPTKSLAQIVGDVNISTHNGTITVSPGSAEEISEILKLASSEHWTVVPVGGMGWIKSTANLNVSTHRLNQIIEHEPADLIAVAQAGVTLTHFNVTLAENGQWLPLDPPDDGRATLGGVVATGIGGPQQFGYGRPRGSVIGMKVVLADGSIIKVGGRVVKNVAGYDLCKLFTGSYGTLGIITELNFKLRPRPEREATVMSTDEPDRAMRAILNARLFPVAMETFSEHLLVRFAGNEKGVAFQIEEARKLLKNAEVVWDDADLWKQIAATRALEGRARKEPSGNAKVLMERIKKQLDPTNILPRINADF